MKDIVIFLVIITIDKILTNSLFTARPLPKDGPLNFTELSEKYGHKAEEHSIETEDGYILTLFHLPGKKKPPVLLSHGLLDSADTFILRGKRSLAISLANKGYDVWAGNARGNRYARQHTKLNPDTDAPFWDFSFHEHGYYDLPATIDYILNITGEKSLQSIAHSEGTTNHFVLGSLRPEYNEKVKILVAMAPSAYISNLEKPLSLLIELTPSINKILQEFKVEEIFRDKGVERTYFESICNQNAVKYGLCGKIVFQIGGDDSKRVEPEFLSVVVEHYPQSSSRKKLIHHAQVALSKRFARFDYGLENNLKRYGFTVPPDYNLRQFTTKTAIIVGENDKLSPIRDVEYLRFLLPNIVQYYVMESKKWNHIDFVWGNDMPKTLFPHIIRLLNKYK